MSNIAFRLLTRDRNVWPGLLLPPQRNKDSNVSVASLQEEVDSQLDSQTRENFLVPMAENTKTSQQKERKKQNRFISEARKQSPDDTSQIKAGCPLTNIYSSIQLKCFLVFF